MTLTQEFKTKSGIRYFSPDRKINEMQPWTMEYTAILRQLYLDSSAILGKFLPTVNEASVDFTTGDSGNNYAYSLYLALHTLGDHAHIVAPIYDTGRSHYSSLYDKSFQASADTAANMRLPSNTDDRGKIYPKLVEKIEKFSGIKMELSAVSDYFERDNVPFEHHAIVDWLYSTLYYVLSSEQLMTNISFRERMDITLGSIYEGMANIVSDNHNRSHSGALKTKVLSNLTENLYFLSRPTDLRVTGEKPVLINRQ